MFRQIQSHIADVMKIDEMKSMLCVSQINELMKQQAANEIKRLSDELEVNRDYLKGVHEDFALKILSQIDFDFMSRHYKLKCDIIERDIQEIKKSMLRNRESDEPFAWIEQYRPFSSFGEVSRPLLAYLVQRITVDSSKNVCVEFLHEREFTLYTLFCKTIRKIHFI